MVALRFIALFVLLCAPLRASAEATFEIVSIDPAGQGFNDATATEPVGGNTGTTLGEQRMIALQHAADLWGAALDSAVPIVIEAQFEDLGCSPGGATLGLGGFLGIESGLTRDDANPQWWYASALANRLAGQDLEPGQADIGISFNSLPDQPGCFGELGFYYGLDAQHGPDVDFVDIALHELAHGLGFSSTLDRQSGAFPFPDSFTTHAFDLGLGMRFDQLSDEQRLQAFQTPRGVVWDGPEVAAQAPQLLDAGAPLVDFAPPVAGVNKLLGDTDFGNAMANISISGELALSDPIDACAVPTQSFTGRVVLVRPLCSYEWFAAQLEQAGAVGMLMALPVPDDGELLPPSSIHRPLVTVDAVGIPVFVISEADASLLEQAIAGGTLEAFMSRQPNVPIGADPMGRPFLNVTDPPTASSLAHFDPLARPSLLMEPSAVPDGEHSLDLTPAVMRDIGWQPFCGNRRLDQAEECDEGEENDDEQPDACRSDCTAARCGDGVVDTGEQCDEAEASSDTLADACRTDCSMARCGDGVVDSQESCDDGEDNSDSEPDTCRLDCSEARCGDSVVDSDEQCDDGADNSDDEPDACRADCREAACGDGVLDSDEQCDDGADNSDRESGACRSDCRQARCGDGVLDDDEECDQGDRNSDTAGDACRTDCRAARCGDGVIDEGELCDTDGDCPEDCGASALSNGGSGGNGGNGGGANAGASGGGGDDGGCGCRIHARPRSARGLPVLLLALLLVLRRRSRVQS